MIYCHYCKRKTLPRSAGPHPLALTRDHYIPLSRGGPNTSTNFRRCCYACNNIKGNMMPDEWEQFMLDNPSWWERFPVGVPKAKAPSLLASATENGRRIKAYLTKYPQVRPLRKDEPIPIEFNDPAEQAAFEAYAKKYRHVLRVSIEEP